MALFGGKQKQNAKQGQESAGSLLSPGMVSIRDLIAPSYIEVDFNHIKIDDRLYRTFFVVGYPRFVSSNWLAPLITFDHPLFISMYVYPTQSNKILHDLKQKIAEMEATIETDIKAGKVVDPTVQVSLDDALMLQAELAAGSERFFQFGLYVTVPADTQQELDTASKEVESLLSSLLIVSKKASLEMESGFKSTLPMFKDNLKVWRNMDTTSLATTFPFITASLSANEGILYGVNQHDGSLVIFDRFGLESANSIILGKSGGGKSFFVKMETLRLLLMDIDVLIIDPENEYKNITKAVGGEFVSFSLSSEFKINPFELAVENPEPDELANKILSLHSLMKVIMGELSPSQEALLDRALVAAYKSRGITPDPKTFVNAPPLLEDLYKVFLGFETEEAAELAARLETFVKGSAAGVFNQQSNFDITNKFTVFGIRDVEESLRPVVMYIVLDYVWNRIRRDRKKRVLVVDEAWYLIKHKDSAKYLYGFAKRARKYQLGLTTITQDVEDFLNVEEGRAILTNSSLQILLKQSTAAIDKIAEIFNITGGEKHFLLSSGVGEGLFFAGHSHVAIKIIASEEEHGLITQV